MITKRSVAVCIVLSLITCGIYSLYWFIKLTDETNFVSGNVNDTNGVTAFLLTLVTCGIYSYYWAYKLGLKLETIEGTVGSSKGVLFLILYFLGLGIVVYALAQDTLNKCA